MCAWGMQHYKVIVDLNVAIGYNSLRNEYCTILFSNSALGTESLSGLTGNNNNNVGVGFSAGRGSQGSNNIFYRSIIWI